MTTRILLWCGLLTLLTSAASARDTRPKPEFRPHVSIYATAPILDESPPSHRVTFIIVRTGNTSAALAVHCAIGGSALNGLDYLRLDETLHFPPFTRSVGITVRVVDDVLVEGTEDIQITLLAD